MESKLKAGQIWAFSKSEYCEYSRFLYIDWVKEFRFGCHECTGTDNVNVIHNVDYLSRWELLDTKACYDLLNRYNVLGCQLKDVKSSCDKVQADAAGLRDELTRMKSEKRTKSGVLVYINNISPVFVDGGISWNFKDDFLYVYGSDGNKIAAFMRSFVFGVSLGGDEVSK